MKILIKSGRVIDPASGTDEQLDILIEDNGPGISDEVKTRLFEPFFSTKTTGMGMGLAITQGILEEHDGKIHVSDGKLGGAAFRLSFPIIEQEQQIA